MSGNTESRLTEDLIRLALRLELDCIETPPVDRAWQRVRSGLGQTRSPIKKQSFGWSRLAAVAAACLVIVIGGIGVFRTVQFFSPAAEVADMPIRVDSVEDIVMLEAADSPVEDLTIMHQDDAEAVKALPSVLADIDPVPPDWMPLIAEEFIFMEAVLLGAPDGPEYQGAYYSGSSADLLWVKSAETDEDLAYFINYLGRYSGFYPEDRGAINRFTRLAAAELPGLAWQKDGHNQALLAISGFISEEELKSIASIIE